MGTKIPKIVPPEPSDEGVACPNCWGPGKKYGADLTPKTLTVDVSGINKGPDWDVSDGEPPEGRYEIEQVAIPICRWSSIIGDLRISVLYGVSTGQAAISRDGGIQIFTTLSHPTCIATFVNNEDAAFKGGTMKISWNVET